LPSEVARIVRGVFGLETWPNVHASARGAAQKQPHSPPAAPQPLTARALAEAYAFPAAADGRGQTVGILFFGAALDPRDLEQSLRPEGIALPEVAIAHVDGDGAAPAPPTPFDVELALDTHVAASLAPGAKLVLYGAPHDERGFIDAVLAALFDERERPSVLSISYGRPECVWTPGAMDVLEELFVAAALLGVSVFCSSGDLGAVEVGDRPRVLFPASSRFVHACGGTQVAFGGEGRRVERSWPDSGGGFSERAGNVPEWQSSASARARRRYRRNARGVPDVSAQAFPFAYPIVVGGPHFAGGTSAVAPLWSALTARLNQQLGTPLGFYAPLLYAEAKTAALFRPVSGEGNGAYAAPEGWTWNPCTGLGVPCGTSLERALRKSETKN
jgi:kumamolisin